MRLIAVGLSVVLCQPALALASSCEATFAKTGNPVTGLRYTAIQSVADITTADAVNQLRGILLARDYDVLAVEAETGEMLIEKPQSSMARSYPIIASASGDGKITTMQLRANLRAGVFAKAEVVREELCSVLAELKGGKAGLHAARLGKTATPGTGAPTALTAQTLADRLSKERDKNAEEIPLRYSGRSFTLSGTVERLQKQGDTYHVIFTIMDPSEKPFLLPGDSHVRTDIVCILAPGQSVYALTLKPRANRAPLMPPIYSSVKLTGTYDSYTESPSVMYLSDCKPNK